MNTNCAHALSLQNEYLGKTAYLDCHFVNDWASVSLSAELGSEIITAKFGTYSYLITAGTTARFETPEQLAAAFRAAADALLSKKNEYAALHVADTPLPGAAV